MTREEAIAWFENWLLDYYDIDDIPQELTAELAGIALAALRQQEHFSEVTKKVEPLTLEELRKMGGEPVFVVTDRLKEWCLVHSHNSDDVIGGGIIMTRRTAEKRTYQYACYGKTWLAYRQKKEI